MEAFQTPPDQMPRRISMEHAEIEHETAERFAHALAGWEARDFERIRIHTKAEKWRSASAIQKAIRRGHVATALTHAQALHDFEPRYLLRRRLAIIALEDRAHGDEKLVAECLWASRAAQDWDEDTKLRGLLMLVNRLCGGTKDRSPCDAGVAATWHWDWADHRGEWDGLPTEALVEIVLSPGEHPVSRVLALGIVAARRKQGLLLDVARQLGISPLQRYIAVGGAVAEGLGVPFLVTSALIRKCAPKEVSAEPDEPIVDLPSIGPWPSYCLDQHNWDGRRAVLYALATVPALRRYCERWGVEKGRGPAVVQELLFRVESDTVDSRLIYPQSRELRRLASESCLNWAGLPGEALDEGLEVLRANMYRLHQARRRVLGVA